MLILGLGVASRYAGAELPTHVRSAVERDAVASQLIARVGQRFFDGSEREVPSTQLSSFRFRMRERRRDRVRYVLRTLFVPGFDHIALVKLPSFLVWLYYPLRCVHDYLALPVWLAGKRVSRAVRDARAVTGAAAR